jgi:hypothetical protein
MSSTTTTTTTKSEWTVLSHKENVLRHRIAQILIPKAEKTRNPSWKIEAELIIADLKRCCVENPETGFPETACKSPMCPAYMTIKYAVPSSTAMRANFASVHRRNLYFVRLTASPSRVTRKELASARRYLLSSAVRLTQSKVWYRTFLSWAGTVHLEWKPRSKKNGDSGFLPHLHLIVEADRFPDIAAIRAAWLRIVGHPEGDLVHHFHFKRVKKYDNAMTYVPHVDNLIPGYREKRGELLLKRMPLGDILAFVTASKGSHRLLRHGFNLVRVQAAVLKAREERAAALKAKKEKAAARQSKENNSGRWGRR